MRRWALQQLHWDWLLGAQVAVAAIDGGQGVGGADAGVQLLEEEGLGARRQAPVAHHLLIGLSQEEGGVSAAQLALDWEVGGEGGGETGLGRVRPHSCSCSAVGH